ncbi:MAG: nucleotidyltransferase family protein [Methanoregulaceae archaeon]
MHRFPICNEHSIIFRSCLSSYQRSYRHAPRILSRRSNSPVLRRLEEAAPVIRATFGVKRIGIFGSFARGDQTRTSDIDVLVEFLPGHETFMNFMSLADFLEERAGRKVDLLSNKWVSPLIRPYIEQDVIWFEN